MARIEISREALRFMTERYTSCYAFLESQQYKFDGSSTLTQAMVPFSLCIAGFNSSLKVVKLEMQTGIIRIDKGLHLNSRFR